MQRTKSGNIPKVQLPFSDRFNVSALNGKYDIRSELGSGGTAKVYYGIRFGDEKPVIIKHISESIEEKDRLGILRSEANALRVKSTSSAKLLDYNHTEGLVVFEYINGVPLIDLIEEQDRNKSLSPQIIYSLLISLAEACAEIHQSSIVHRDLSAKNIFISSDLEIKIIDFGMSVDVNTFAEITGGTPSVLCPQQINPSQSAEFHFDIYALAAIGYKLLSGIIPHEDLIDKTATNSKNNMELIRQRIKNDPTSLVKFSSQIPKSLDQLISDKCLSKEPKSRPYDALDFKSKLLAICQDLDFINPRSITRFWKDECKELIVRLISATRTNESIHSEATRIADATQLDNDRTFMLDNNRTIIIS